MANRFSQIVQPYVVNPTSVEDFMRVPMARAAAKASGLKLATSMAFDYNVADQDLNDVQKIVAPIEKGKEALIDRLMAEGSSEDLVNEFLQLKKSYTYASKQIGMAERNKVNIDEWEKNLMRTHKNSQYMENVKRKELSDWGGTFAKDKNGEFVVKETGSMDTRSFAGELGPNYINIEDDFFNQLKGITKTLIKETPGGGRFVYETDPNGKKIMAWQTTKGKREYSNENKLVKRAEMLMSDYSDPKTQRGAFATYMGITPENLEEIKSNAIEASISENVLGGESSKQILSTKATTTAPKTPPLPLTGIEKKFKEGVFKKRLNEAKNQKLMGFWRSAGATFVEGLKGIAANEMAASGNIEEAEKLRRESAEEGSAASYLNKKDFVKYADEFNQDVVSLASNLSNNLLLGEGRASNGISSSSTKLANDLRRVNKEYSDAVTIEEKRDAYNNQLSVLKNHYNSTTSGKFEGNFITSNSSYIADVRRPDWNINASLRDKSTAVALNLPILDLNEKKAISEDDRSKLQAGIDNYLSGNVKEDEYTIKYVGEGDANSQLYTTSDGKVMESVIFGSALILQKMGKDGVPEQIGRYILSPNVDKNNQSYATAQAKMSKISKVSMGDIHNAVIIDPNTNEKIEGAVENLVIPILALNSRGEEVMAEPGQMVVYTGDDLPRLYNTAMFDYLFIGDQNQASKYKIKSDMYVSDAVKSKYSTEELE